MAGAFRDINEISGLYTSSPPPPDMVGGFIGISHISGVWIWGAPPYVPPEPGEGRYSRKFIVNIGRLMANPRRSV